MIFLDAATMGSTSLEPISALGELVLHTSHPERLRFTPHIGWASKEALERLVLRIAENIKMTDLSA